MSNAIRSPSTLHKRAAADHELAALQHRTAAEYHDKSMLHAARRSSENAKECSLKAHKQSLLACQQSAYTTSTVGAARNTDRESRRLEDATDAELQAELAAITTQPVAGALAPRARDYPRRVEG